MVQYALLAAVLPAGNLSAALNGIEFFPENYGAVAGDDEDDRSAIQAALEAAAAAGGATVRLSAGIYDVRMVVSNGYGPVNGYSGGTSGYQGVVVPVNCTLAGAGMSETTLRFRAVLSAHPAPIGVGLVNGGYQTATVDFGAGGGIHIEDLRVETPDVTYNHAGNLIGLAHADGVTISRVAIGASSAHGLEINKSRNIVVEDCDFDGPHYGTATLQLDIGYFGAKSLRPPGTVLSDILVRRCQFRGRGSELGGGKVIELGHTSSSCILRNIAFEDCLIESMTHPGTVCVATDNPPAQEISGLRFERCHFVGFQEAPTVNGLLQLPLQGTQLLQDITVRGCLFSGAYWNGLIIVSGYTTQYGGWEQRRNILIEENHFAPALDRRARVSGSGIRPLSVAACRDVVIRRNLFEVPATAANLALTHGVVSCQTANNLSLRVEDNVFSWAHASQAAAPLGFWQHTGLLNAVWALEQNGIRASVQLTGNTFLYPPNGIAAAIRMSTDIPTTSWAQGGPWVGGFVAGNYASGFSTASPWVIHHDLSSADNVGDILPLDAARGAAAGWYPCNGAALTSLDSGNHRLARVNAGKCGYTASLPVEPGCAVRLHGPLHGEGLLLDSLAPHRGAPYRGLHQNLEELTGVPFESLTDGELRAVRQPLGVFRWMPLAEFWMAGSGTCAPLDRPYGHYGLWVPLRCEMEHFAADADADGDGLSTREEIALLRDPAVAEPPPAFDCSPAPDGAFSFSFRCRSGPHAPPLRILSSDDLTNWTTESAAPAGGVFAQPAAGSISEAPSKTGRRVTLTAGPQSRRFWRLSFDP